MAGQNVARQTTASEKDAYGGPQLTAISALFLVLTTLFTVARLASRRMIREVTWGMDDLLVAVAYLLCVALCACGFIFVHKNDKPFDPSKYSNEAQLAGALLKRWGELIYVAYTIYFAACAMAKLSILVLYNRIFVARWNRLLTTALIVVVIANWIATTLAGTFQCIPVQKAWDAQLSGHCVDQKALYKFSTLPNIITDIPMLILPIPSCLKLNASFAKKAGLLFIFVCGSLGMIASIVRFAIFIENNGFSNLSYSLRAYTAWSIIEPSLYLIASCTLAIHPLLQKIIAVSSRFRHYISNIASGNRTQQADDSLALANIQASHHARSKGFATLADNDRSGSEEDLVDSAIFFKQDHNTSRSEAIGVRRDVWVTEGNSK